MSNWIQMFLSQWRWFLHILATFTTRTGEKDSSVSAFCSPDNFHFSHTRSNPQIFLNWAAGFLSLDPETVSQWQWGFFSHTQSCWADLNFYRQVHINSLFVLCEKCMLVLCQDPEEHVPFTQFPTAPDLWGDLTSTFLKNDFLYRFFLKDDESHVGSKTNFHWEISV